MREEEEDEVPSPSARIKEKKRHKRPLHFSVSLLQAAKLIGHNTGPDDQATCNLRIHPNEHSLVNECPLGRWQRALVDERMPPGWWAPIPLIVGTAVVGPVPLTFIDLGRPQYIDCKVTHW